MRNVVGVIRSVVLERNRLALRRAIEERHKVTVLIFRVLLAAERVLVRGCAFERALLHGLVLRLHRVHRHDVMLVEFLLIRRTNQIRIVMAGFGRWRSAVVASAVANLAQALHMNGT